MRIVHHNALSRRGGAVRVARLLAGSLPDLLPDHQHNFSFELAETDADARTLTETPWPQRLAHLARSADLLHLHSSTDWPALLALLSELPNRPPVVLTLHDCRVFTGGCPYPLDCAHAASGCIDPCPRAFPAARTRAAASRDLLARLQPAIVAPSRWIRQQFAATHPDLAAHLPITVVPNGVEVPTTPPTREARTAARARFSIHPSARVALFLAHGGTDAAYKGGDRWLALWKLVAPKVPGGLAVIAGGDHAAPHTDATTLHMPFVPPEDLPQLLYAADALAYPARADNHPLIILEAMAHHLPIAAFGVGGILEQLAHQQTALLAPPADYQTLATHMVTLLTTPHTARTLATRAYDVARARFTTQRMARDYARVYERL